ncbi:hypothetical protein F2Q69_00057527, partial [Brassica cretica]
SPPEVSDSEAQHPPPSLLTPEISHSKSDICSVSHGFSTATNCCFHPRRRGRYQQTPPTSSSFFYFFFLSPQHVWKNPQISERTTLASGEAVRERPYNQPNPTHNRRNVDSSPLPRSGLLEGPRRRSRSPATRGPSSARRSPMKKREAALEKEGAEVKVKKEVAVEEKKEEEDVAVREPDVSMECFIFL